MKKNIWTYLTAAVISCMVFTGCSVNENVAVQVNEDVAVEVNEDAAVQVNEDAAVQAPELFIDSNGFAALHVDGTQLMDTENAPVQFRGISTHGINWYGDYVNQELFNELSTDWNINVIRLALYTESYNGYCMEETDREQLMELMKQGIEYATNAGLYVIVDWHMGSDDWDPNEHVDEAKSFFNEISSEYGDHYNVIYEICNEPWDPTKWEDIKNYADEVIPVIRKNAEHSVILCGTPHWSQYVTLAGLDPLEFEDVMYVMHFYAATHKDGTRDTLMKAIDKGIPVFVTEFGTCGSSGNGALDLESAAAWIKLMDDNKISYCIWNLSNKDEASALILPDCDKTHGFMDSDLTEQGLWYRNLCGGHEPEAEE